MDSKQSDGQPMTSISWLRLEVALSTDPTLEPQ